MAYTPNIQALKKGDSQAFENLVDAYKNQILRLCLGFFSDYQEAEDLTQEVFVEVYLKVQHFNEQAQLFTWIYRIAVNKCLEEQRRRKQQKRASYFKNLLGIGEEALDVEDKLNAHPGYSAENQDRAKFILAALEKLPDNQRIAFTLMQTQGHSTKEVADIMNVSFSSVESLVFRAKKNLQKHLEKIKDDL